MTTLLLQQPTVLSSLATPRPAAAKQCVCSEDLFRNSTELIIEHRGEEYRLKLTRNDKLILNK